MNDFSQTCNEDTSRLSCLRREEVNTGSGSDRVLDPSEGRVWQEDYPVATAPGTDLLVYQAEQPQTSFPKLVLLLEATESV
jgi:hypothetical protein